MAGSSPGSLLQAISSSDRSGIRIAAPSSSAAAPRYGLAEPDPDAVRAACGERRREPGLAELVIVGGADDPVLTQRQSA